MISPGEIEAMKTRTSWRGLATGVELQIRQIRALDAYHFDAQRFSTLEVPTLLLAGGKTASSDLKRAISPLLDFLPNRTLVVFQGQEHNAMDNVPSSLLRVRCQPCQSAVTRCRTCRRGKQ